MNFFKRVKGWFELMFSSKAKEVFDVKPVTSSLMDSHVAKCIRVYQGVPDWVDSDDGIDTINLARSICSEVARLATLNVKITLSGSERADWLQKQAEKICSRLRRWVEYGCAYGTVILKPTVEGVDMIAPEDFIITDCLNGEVRGVVFKSYSQSADGNRCYTRLEYHRFADNGNYMISNRCYVGYKPGDMAHEIDISLTPWSELSQDVAITNISRPLFAVFRMPQANNIDIESPLGLPIFSDALRELRDIDIAYSRNTREIFDSKRTVLLDSDTLMPFGDNTILTSYGAERQRKAMGLPDFVKNVNSSSTEDFYQEINPTLNTDTRLTGINALLNQIGYKCGFSNGYFVFNEKTGFATATQVEADQQRTIQLIAELESAVKGLIYALNAFADLYNLAPRGTYDEASMLHFDDVTYNFEEDKMHHYSLVVQGKYPLEEYYVRYLGCSRDEAQRLIAMTKAENSVPQLFDDELE